MPLGHPESTKYVGLTFDLFLATTDGNYIETGHVSVNKYLSTIDAFLTAYAISN